MHKYLKSIGFRAIENKKQLDLLLEDVVQNYDFKKVAENEQHHIFAEFIKEYGYDCGVRVCGEYDEEDHFNMEYFFPYYTGSQIASMEDLVIERHAEKQSYAGALDDIRVGISMIFYLQNTADYLKVCANKKLREVNTSVTLSALADSGKILLPVKKVENQKEDRQMIQKRTNLIKAARNGDEEAMESLTMEDIDTYSMLSKRIQYEDIYSIVDTFFMPHGIECDQYQVMGEIVDYNTTVNTRTGERMVQLGIVTSDIPLDICINEKDLMGVPEIGRRFKGVIWLQGMINF